MAATYTVVKGDNLWDIARVKLGSGLKWTYLADINNISRSKPIIYPKQVLLLEKAGTSPSVTTPTTTTSQATIQYFGLQAGTEATVFAVWTWDRSNTENYQVIWYYDTGNGVWFIGSDSKITDKQSVYSAPSNAKKVKMKVLPISKTHKVNNKDTHYWTGKWSTEKTYNFLDNPPQKPPTPTAEITKYTMTAEVNNVSINATHIDFNVVRDNTTVFKNGLVPIVTTRASFSFAVDAGGEYKVRCRGYREGDKSYGDWSDYSNNYSTIPSTPSGITTCKAISETSVYLEWSPSNTATKYDIEYATEKRYFEGSNETTVISSIESTHYEKTGLETGNEYFFRVRSVNTVGSSSWSGLKSVILGKKPAPPTTWASSTTVVTGEQLNLYWVHNSQDGSSQEYAEVEIIKDGIKNTYTIRKPEDPDLQDQTNAYPIDTSLFIEGTKIQWRVRTAGVTLTYGEWSIQRVVDVYAPPTLNLSVNDILGASISVLDSFPFYIKALAGPQTQRPIGYHVSIYSTEYYEHIDSVGRKNVVNAGEAVYSKYFDINDPLLMEMSAFNVDLDNNITYRVSCVVSMDSGLNTEDHSEFIVAWTDEQYEPMAEIGYDDDTYVTYISPYCVDENELIISDVSLSIYRREFDGTFTEIASGLKNNRSTFVVDPHPSLDYARYRIVAITNSTGAVSYYDPPGYPINEKAVIIQWDEDWTMFDTLEGEALEKPPWSGSLLRLPYNIDVSDKYNLDVSHVGYIGRSHPVSYYGTQIGETASWKVDIEKTDAETIYAIRRLARWLGNVYVREPSGSGYWASISVSFNQTHGDLIIPVSIDITRVEGGM